MVQPPPAGTSDPPPSRWTLSTIRAAVPALAGYSLSGVWRVLRRSGITPRRGREQAFSPDPDSAEKVADVEAVLAGAPDQIEALFVDEMGYARWPEPGRIWGPEAPAPAPRTDRAGAPPRLWRLVGALNAVTGRVAWADGYTVGRRQLIAFYRRVAAACPDAESIDVIQDNWSIHRHADVLAAMEAMTEFDRIIPIWLPAYAPWLNPIEKLWRKLRQEVLRQHRLAGDWAALQARVHAFFAQFRHASPVLLDYVGLRDDGRLARALRRP
ncbi:MAG: IS630 family transposase [Chloroflexota bacterium]|nr:IS630 family transposase [Chloroflexota bacterium]